MCRMHRLKGQMRDIGGEMVYCYCETRRRQKLWNLEHILRDKIERNILSHLVLLSIILPIAGKI